MKTEGKGIMVSLKFGEKEYQIKFAYEPTLKSGIVNKLVKQDDLSDEESIDSGLMMLPEMLLVGLQAKHRDDFGYNYLTGDGKDEQLSKVFAMLDDYFDDDDSDFTELYGKLQEEMLSNGFLAAMFRGMMKEQNTEQKKSTKRK